ncbi:interferon-induced protein 44-like isoform X2 [Alosa pseudoharengus]|uniref:interferon-induced protein 44-like isoform X2 n=1 Tax=Alosa pseudoharengus TaxID=34774 RepID=UPI003F8B6861
MSVRWIWAESHEFQSHICDNKVKRGEDIVFRCEANTDQLQTTWEKDGQMLYDGDRVSISQRGKVLSLMISKAKEEDEGKYTITLRNDTGTASESASVSLLQFDRDWRTIEWGKSVSVKRSLQEYKLSGQGPKHLRFLLHGPVGAGKSSIINSINSIFQDQVKMGALAATSSEFSFTKVYKTWQIKDMQTGLLPFVFSDIMGLEMGDYQGIHTDDIISILKGLIKENYKFNLFPLSKEDTKGYNNSPTLDDKVHCLVNVLSAKSINLMEENNNVFKKMREVREHASDIGIPQVVFMTHVDLACPLVKDNLKNIYSSKIIKKRMQECSNKLGVPMNCIFPVKNYHEEIHLNDNVNCLILNALKQAIGFADDYVSNCNSKSDFVVNNFSE